MAPRQKKLTSCCNDLKKRKDFFKQRFPGFKKKAIELSVLCGNSVGFICYGPDNNDLHVLPENPQKLEQIFAQFKAQSDQKRKKHRCDLKDFPNFDGLSVEELNSHLSQINSQLDGVKQKKTQLVINEGSSSSDHIVSQEEEEEHRPRVSRLGFGGSFDELGYIVRGCSDDDCVPNLGSAALKVYKDDVDSSRFTLGFSGGGDYFSAGFCNNDLGFFSNLGDDSFMPMF